ncbi:hypothetical protein C6H65_14960 [Photorhabdus luminescens]|nr:hypothetical protein C6H65_14960 [Photorhabdus luminescens]
MTRQRLEKNRGKKLGCDNTIGGRQISARMSGMIMADAVSGVDGSCVKNVDFNAFKVMDCLARGMLIDGHSSRNNELSGQYPSAEQRQKSLKRRPYIF